MTYIGPDYEARDLKLITAAGLPVRCLFTGNSFCEGDRISDNTGRYIYLAFVVQLANVEGSLP
jgi:hypothetical protein